MKWLPVVGFEGKYEVSNKGNIRAIFKNGKMRELSGYEFNGYRRVKLRINGQPRNLLAHRVVAEAFLPTINGKDFVNHKDGVRCNNCVDNLEWCTPKENVIHAHSTGLVGSKIGNSFKQKRAICQSKGIRIRGDKYQVAFQFNHKKIWGGSFATEQEASEKYSEIHSRLKREFHGSEL